MRVQDSVIIEVDQLVFAAPTHASHARSGQGAPLLRRHAPCKRTVMELEGQDPPADEVATQQEDGAFDFRKFGHVR
jgi:hypothetical protein